MLDASAWVVTGVWVGFGGGGGDGGDGGGGGVGGRRSL